MKRRLALVALGGALVAMLVPPLAEAKTKTVVAGALERPPRGVDTNAFFRKNVTVNVGDTVRWDVHGFHNIAFPARGEDPPGLLRPNPAAPYSGFNDAAGAPFWFNGQPRLEIPPEVAFPAGGRTHDGRSYLNSGLPDDPPKPYRVRFTRTGRFDYYCLIHPGMKGTVTVVRRRRSVPSARSDRRAARREYRATVARARRLARFTPEGNRVVAGHDRGAAALFRFFPALKTIRVGESIDFSIDSKTEIHTVTFGPQATLRRLANEFLQVQPGQPPTLSLHPQVAFPSDPPPALPPHNGANHGEGFLNTGILDTHAATPNPSSARVTFTRAGTYEFICVIHPGMTGRIRVQ